MTGVLPARATWGWYVTHAGDGRITSIDTHTQSERERSVGTYVCETERHREGEEGGREKKHSPHVTTV